MQDRPASIANGRAQRVPIAGRIAQVVSTAMDLRKAILTAIASFLWLNVFEAVRDWWSGFVRSPDVSNTV